MGKGHLDAATVRELFLAVGYHDVSRFQPRADARDRPAPEADLGRNDLGHAVADAKHEIAIEPTLDGTGIDDRRIAVDTRSKLCSDKLSRPEPTVRIGELGTQLNGPASRVDLVVDVRQVARGERGAG